MLSKHVAVGGTVAVGVAASLYGRLCFSTRKEEVQATSKFCFEHEASVWHEEVSFPESRDYVLYKETRWLGLPVKRNEVGMFRLKVARDDQAELALLYLKKWAGDMCKPDDADIEAAKILVDKLKTVAKANNIKTIRAGIPLGQEGLYEACGFKRDAGHLRFVLHDA